MSVYRTNGPLVYLCNDHIHIKRNNYMMYFCLGLICLFREWPVVILKGVILRLSVKQVGS